MHCEVVWGMRRWLAILAIFAVHSAAASQPPIADTPFEQEYREPFLFGSSAEENNVRAIAADRTGRFWIATAGGVFYRAPEGWIAPDKSLNDGPAYAVECDDAGNIWIGTWRGLFRATRPTDRVTVSPVAEVTVPIAVIASDKNRVLAGGPDGYWDVGGKEPKKLEGPWGTSVQAILIDGDELWIGTQTALFHTQAGNTRRLHEAADLLSADVRALARSSDGRIWIGSNGGIDVYDHGRRVASFTGREGLPSTRVHSLDFDSAGKLWIGTALGLVRYDGQNWSLRHSLRWLPSDDVRGVAFDGQGKSWVATSSGIGVLAHRTMTLADKAAYFEDVVRKRHVREPGLVRKCRLQVPGDLSTFKPTDTDNDGLFSSLYLAAESFRYATTKDESAKQNAAAVYRGLEFLQTITDTPGFVARTVIPADWSNMSDRNRTYTPQQLADERVQDPRFKRVETRWRKSRDGRWLWKGDTSSDEISGHYFGYAVYYDLVADEAERKRVREHVRRITDYIIAGGLTLRDTDGQPTLWAVWSPEKLNGDPNWFSERGTNSIEILSFLRVAEHMTGDKKYAKQVEELLNGYGYRELIKTPKLASPAEFTFIDDQLLALCYRAIFAYAPSDADRALFRPGLDQWQRAIQQVHSPLYDFVYTIASGQPTDAAPHLAYLRDVPLDLVNWSMDNTHREDISLVPLPNVSRRNTSRLLPPSERGIVQWDGNVYQANEGGGGHEECEPHFWLLPYWMGRHHGLIAPPAAPAR